MSILRLAKNKKIRVSYICTREHCENTVFFILILLETIYHVLMLVSRSCSKFLFSLQFNLKIILFQKLKKFHRRKVILQGEKEYK